MDPKTLAKAGLAFLEKGIKQKEKEAIRKVAEEGSYRRKAAHVAATEVGVGSEAAAEVMKKATSGALRGQAAGPKDPALRAAALKVQRRRPINSLVSIVLAYLRSHLNTPDMYQTNDDIYFATSVDVDQHAALATALRASGRAEKVKRGPALMWHYVSRWKIKNKEQFVELMQANPNGVLLSEFDDAYDNIMEDIKDAIESGDIISLPVDGPHNPPMLFPTPTRPKPIKVDQKFKEYWKQVEMPKDRRSLNQEVFRLGLKTKAAAEESEKAGIKEGIAGIKRNRETKEGEVDAVVDLVTGGIVPRDVTGDLGEPGVKKRKKRISTKRSNMHLNADLSMRTSAEVAASGMTDNLAVIGKIGDTNGGK